MNDNNQAALSRLFVYGIFLDEYTRDAYGMSNPKYDTVKDYATYGGHIVTACYVPNYGLSLTGLLVDIDPRYWGRLDALEYGYQRIVITTISGTQAYIYAERLNNEKNNQ